MATILRCSWSKRDARVHCKPSSLVKGGSHKGHPEEWKSPWEQLSGDPRRQSYASIQKLSLLRTLEKISSMPWEECMPLANAETEPEKREHLVQGHTVSHDRNPSRVQLALHLALCPFSIPKSPHQ